MPFPLPKGAPTGLWDGGKITVQMAPVPGIALSGAWQSPVFDLRPDLRSSTGGMAEGVPIWRASGLSYGAKLWVMIDGLNTNNNWCTSMRVTYEDLVSPNQGDQMRVINSPQDITTEFSFTGNKNAVLLCFSPAGFTYPVRFWSTRLNWTWGVAPLTLPRFILYSAMY